MRATGLLLAATVGLAVAETVDLFLPIADPQSLLAFSLGSDASATTWLVGCPTDSQSADCGFPMGFTIAQGPKTAHFSLVQETEYTVDYNCKLEAETFALCTMTLDGSSIAATDFFQGITSTVASTSGDLSSIFLPATIVTNSASILNSGGLPTGGIVFNTEEVSSTTTKSSSGSTQTPAVTSAPTLATSSKPGSTTVASTTVATTSSKAGVPQITGSSRWVVGGMAALALVAL